MVGLPAYRLNRLRRALCVTGGAALVALMSVVVVAWFAGMTGVGA
jgi:hypothetical protein